MCFLVNLTAVDCPQFNTFVFLVLIPMSVKPHLDGSLLSGHGMVTMIKFPVKTSCAKLVSMAFRKLVACVSLYLFPQHTVLQSILFPRFFTL